MILRIDMSSAAANPKAALVAPAECLAAKNKRPFLLLLLFVTHLKIAFFNLTSLTCARFCFGSGRFILRFEV
jgi:hypothetical protein